MGAWALLNRRSTDSALSSVPPPHPSTRQVACYELELATGSHPEAGTTAKVYLELCGEGGSSGEHRLMYREGASPPRPAFAAGAVDAFRLHCSPLGHLVKASLA